MTTPVSRTYDSPAERDRLFRALVENSFDVILIVGADAVCRYASPSVARVMGWKPEEVVGTSVFDYMRPEDDKWARDTHQAVVADAGFDGVLEVDVRHKSGAWRRVEAAVRNMLDDPAVSGIVCNYRDVTDHKHWENALRESEERYQKAFMSSPDGIAISRLSDGVFLDVNEGFERITGFKREEMIGKSSLRLNHWKNPQDRDRLIAHVRKQGRVTGFMAEFLDHDGNVHVGQLSVDTVVLGGERCMLATTRDITAQVNAQRKIERMSREVHAKHDRLVEKNTALRQLLDHVQDEKNQYRHHLTATVEDLLRPMLDRVEASGGRLDNDDLTLLERRLEMIVHRGVDEYMDNMAKLTPRERDICSRLREGHSSRQIAQELGLSRETVNKHRQSIRRKLQIDHRGINLTSYLRAR
ncbi:MAG: PAS domain S-box protein [Gemmatimonadales bacterium]|jgi:PAS domain S-box-containing protein